ncbi:MarR family transcriptional regulator [Dactylosporangium sp. AC04546]|uniref:GbsR/MarR family transcriptional regulator n=1 Tax=Dactylosporangium sp. AC04546 TaxID=2862460 RepID=UPI001EE01699|nr:MarR family transcriptional regulator [Dactylosporangium sp. AC04546]WVK78196.1 MarR family transcriptional regulator [Dactylosporangium sp. AC04546]
MERDPAKTSRYIERFAVAFTDAGMPRMPSRVLAALLATDSGRRTAAELATTLKASPAAISGAVRYLIQVHMVAREREPGTRHDVFHVHNDVWYEAIFHREPLLDRWAATFREAANAFDPTTPAGRRADTTAEFFEFLLDEMPAMLDRWKAHRAARQQQETLQEALEAQIAGR